MGRRSPVGLDPGLVVHNSERSLVLADMDSHYKIDFLSGRGILEVNFRVDPGSSRVFESAFVCRVLKRCDVGSAAAKKRELRKTCVQRRNHYNFVMQDRRLRNEEAVLGSDDEFLNEELHPVVDKSRSPRSTGIQDRFQSNITPPYVSYSCTKKCNEKASKRVW